MIKNNTQNGFKFTQWKRYESNNMVHCMVSFVPAETIDCYPPIIKGKKDSCWIKFRVGKEPKSKAELEKCLGMSILSWE